MDALLENINLEKLAVLIDEYNKVKEQKINYNLLEMLNKGKKELFELYLSGIEFKIIVGKVSTISGISAYDIKEVFPKEASLVLSYIVNNTNIDKSMKIKVAMYDETMLEPFMYVEALNMATNIKLIYDNNKISPTAMDDYYKVSKGYVKKARKTFFGTLLGMQPSKYFQPKNNSTILPIDIFALKGKNKNYLEPKNDEYLVIDCPICSDKKVFVFSNINEYFRIKKKEVTIVCSHSKSEYMYEKPPHIINVDREITENITKEDIFMYIINNRRYFGLFKEQ